MTTKERIIDESLTLFSIKGFKGTSVKNIADAVGIKDSSLYKHFKTKREILDTIVNEMSKRMENMSEQMGLPTGKNYEESAKVYGKLTVRGLQEVSRKIFLFYLKDEFVSRFWRMSMIEQYQNPDIYEIYSHIFFEESIIYQTNLFREMIKIGAFIEINPEVMAINFYSPIFFLLNKYNAKLEKEQEALKILDSQIEEFCRIYKNN